MANLFIASSAELRPERLELIDLPEDMEDFHAVVWESMDSALRAGRKEDEYLQRLQAKSPTIVHTFCCFEDVGARAFQ